MAPATRLIPVYTATRRREESALQTRSSARWARRWSGSKPSTWRTRSAWTTSGTCWRPCGRGFWRRRWTN